MGCDNLNCQNSNENIGKRVAYLRTKKGLSQASLAELIGTTAKHISEIERGITGISIDLQVLLCEELHCSMDFLIRGNEYATVDYLIPDKILEIFKSKDEKEISLLLDFLYFYQKIRTIADDKKDEK